MAAFDIPHTVLVVDDEEEILELLGEYLRARGFDLRTAYDGEAALEIVRNGGVDIVLTDMKMPHMGGVELLEHIRALQRPVATILMTGYGTVETAISAMNAGAYDYLLKPFRLRDVHAALVRAAERLSQERENARMRNLLSFYELAVQMKDTDSLPRLTGLLAEVARAETGASEVALWLVGGGGWDAVARGGGVDALRRVDVGAVPEEGAQDDRTVVVPLWVEGRRVGALAVAGGDPHTSQHKLRLRDLGQVLTQTLERLAWRPDR
jgi:CheY-like chemotaxis protein